MTLLLIGMAIWWGAHLLRGLAPAARASLDDRFGVKPAKGVIAVLLVLSVVLLVLGHQTSDFTPVYDPPTWTVHLNNLLMLIAVILFGASHSANNIKRVIRHPMLTSVKVWAFAHLIANGDLSSVLLFGGLLIWAVVQMIVINRREGPRERPGPAPIARDIKAVVIGTVVFIVITGLHFYVGGVWPFPR